MRKQKRKKNKYECHLILILKYYLIDKKFKIIKILFTSLIFKKNLRKRYYIIYNFFYYN